MTRAAHSAPPGFDAATLEQLLERLARFSADGPGVTRFTYDDAWCEAHRWLRAEAKARGLEATVDAAGNLLLHDTGVRPGQAGPLLMGGSHLDPVRHGWVAFGPAAVKVILFAAVAAVLLQISRRRSAPPSVSELPDEMGRISLPVSVALIAYVLPVTLLLLGLQIISDCSLTARCADGRWMRFPRSAI
jgi:hypothetical protein